MRRWPLLILATAMLYAGAFARGDKNQPAISNDHLKLLRKAPAFIAGYDDGYRRGGNDSEALGSYRDESFASQSPL